jgi:Uma2 family endonuclease
VDSWIVAMAPERGAHLRVKGAIYKALDRAVAVAGVPCQPLPDGATVETGDSDYEPDALVNCGEPKADDAVAAPNPVIIVEVLSPGTTSTDTGGKLADYFRVPSVAHYLIVHPTRRTVTHHRRTDDGIDTRIVVNGPIRMAPRDRHHRGRNLRCRIGRSSVTIRFGGRFGGPTNHRFRSIAAAAELGRYRHDHRNASQLASQE